MTLTTITVSAQTSEKEVTFLTLARAEEISEEQAFEIANDFMSASEGIEVIYKRYDV